MLTTKYQLRKCDHGDYLFADMPRASKPTSVPFPFLSRSISLVCYRHKAQNKYLWTGFHWLCDWLKWQWRNGLLETNKHRLPVRERSQHTQTLYWTGTRPCPALATQEFRGPSSALPETATLLSWRSLPSYSHSWWHQTQSPHPSLLFPPWLPKSNKWRSWETECKWMSNYRQSGHLSNGIIILRNCSYREKINEKWSNQLKRNLRNKKTQVSIRRALTSAQHRRWTEIQTKAAPCEISEQTQGTGGS